MQFGNWELRENDYTSYYLSKSAMIFPSSNAIDTGKLNTEENVRNIYRDIVGRNYVLKYNYFSMSINPTRDGIILSPGEAIINGYHFYAKNSIEIKVPNNSNYNSNAIENQNITQYTLGISLSYDAANHVTGDVVNKEAELGESEVLSGVYVAWFDECQLDANYDNILVLGRAWVQQGNIVKDGTVISREGNDETRIIYHGFEQDPFKDHKFEANEVELQIYGHKTTKYDTLRDNMTEIHDPLYTYDTVHFPIELDRQLRTKHPTFISDIQDFVNHMPDWYTSKYGDYMTGALRFNNLSIDAKREFLKQLITKDSTPENERDEVPTSDSVFISPRTYGDLTRKYGDSVENEDYDYNVGGTIMTIVPGTYGTSTDYNYGYVGIQAALVAQKYGEAGLRLHGQSDGENLYNTTRIVHYNKDDSGQKYDKTIFNNNNEDNHKDNTSKFIIENIDNTGRKASINIKNGEIFIDTFSSETNNTFSETWKNDENVYNGNYKGSGVQIFASNDNGLVNNVDFRFDQTYMSMADHRYIKHRLGNRGTQHSGLKSDTLHFELGLGIKKLGKNVNNGDEIVNEVYSYELEKHTTNSSTSGTKDPYLELGNLRIRSLSKENNKPKQNFIEIINNSNNYIPYISLLPRVYSQQYLAEQMIQIGTNAEDNTKNNEAQNDTLNKILLKRINKNSNSNDGYTFIEQSFKYQSSINEYLSKIYNRITPVISGVKLSNIPTYTETSGIFSIGNIGCSSKILDSSYANSPNTNNDPYDNNSEWVRFTRFRYNLDMDEINFGNNVANHNSSNGRIWGDTYNIEFNTQVSNRRANQIIWRYKGSTGSQTADLQHTPPVVLSYIHDNPEGNGISTKYSNVDRENGLYETWTDHVGVQQYNPTYRIRDFLYLENAGLIVSGDINNPSPQGDSLNTNVNRFGTTILGGRVYNAVYNDFAETYEKDDVNEVAQVGEIITLNPETGKYKVANNFEDKLVVGVQSNTYSFLAGGNRVNNTQDLIELENEYFTVGIAGKVWIRVVNEEEDCINCHINPGDLLTTSNVKGKACQSKYLTQGTIIGKALTKPKYFEKYNCNMVLMQIMLG